MKKCWLFVNMLLNKLPTTFMTPAQCLLFLTNILVSNESGVLFYNPRYPIYVCVLGYWDVGLSMAINPALSSGRNYQHRHHFPVNLGLCLS